MSEKAVKAWCGPLSGRLVFALLLLSMGTMTAISVWAFPSYSGFIWTMAPLNGIVARACRWAPMTAAASTSCVVSLLLFRPRALWVRSVLTGCGFLLATVAVSLFLLFGEYNLHIVWIQYWPPSQSSRRYYPFELLWIRHGYSMFLAVAGSALVALILHLSQACRIRLQEQPVDVSAKLSIAQVLKITAIIAMLIKLWSVVDPIMWRDSETVSTEINLFVSGFAYGMVVFLLATVVLGHQLSYVRISVVCAMSVSLAFISFCEWAGESGYAFEDVWDNLARSALGSGLIAATHLLFIVSLLLWLRRCGYRIGTEPAKSSLTQQG